MELRKYLQQPYQGKDSFLEHIIYPIFGKNNFQEGYNEDILHSNPYVQKVAESTGISSLIRLGDIELDYSTVHVFDITVKDRIMMSRNRVGIQQAVRRLMQSYTSAFMVFHYEDEGNEWRFSFCDKGSRKDGMSDGKRYTFLFGQGQKCRTAADNFQKLIDKSSLKDGANLDRADLLEAFSVESLSKEFFNVYKAQYDKFVQYVCDNFLNEFKTLFKEKELNSDDMAQKYARDYVKKLLGRIVFLHFLQKKGWMGVPEGKEWGEGDMNFMYSLFDNASNEQKDNFLDGVLEPLFNNALNTNRAGDQDLYDTNVMFGNSSKVRMPYLNGGLFERDEADDLNVKIPRDFFKELFEFFNQYNFTIDENDPNEALVGVDPEMLGHIFENLLEDNKDKGAYYTPKEIVHFMCRESLKAYLETHLGKNGISYESDVISNFVETKEIADLSTEMKAFIKEALKTVKVCDPAIGSGAFPMGMLNELLNCRIALGENIEIGDVKREIIEKNIYGVDIEKGAVDIARLRFWLSLVVDEVHPRTLPNLDYKIMQGNSLLEQYENVDLSTLTGKTERIDGMEISLFESESDLYAKDLRYYLDCYYKQSDHATKAKIKKDIQNTVHKQLELQNLHDDFYDIDLAANDKFFLWHTWFMDVFGPSNNNPGFDIVIGNPPYKGVEGEPKSLKTLYKKLFKEVWASQSDLYVLFTYLALNLLRERGHMCFIISNKWMKAGYGKPFRKFLSKHSNLKTIVDFSSCRVFKSASVDPNIVLLQNDVSSGNTMCSTYQSTSDEHLTNISQYVKDNHIENKFNGQEKWVFLNPIEKSIEDKIKKHGIPLCKWNVKIHYGIKTGLNEAFIIDDKTREDILSNCSSPEEEERTAKIIRPILRGRDIKNDGYQWAGTYIIATFPSLKYDIENYPSLKSYLLEYRIERLEQSGMVYNISGEKIKSRKRTNNKWYETQDTIDYWEDFSKPKVIWPRTMRLNKSNVDDFPRFKYDPNNFYLVDSLCFIVGGYELQLEFILNSIYATYYFLKYIEKLDSGGYLMRQKLVEEIPIPQNFLNCKCDNDIFNAFKLTAEEIEYLKKFILEVKAIIRNSRI